MFSSMSLDVAHSVKKTDFGPEDRGSILLWRRDVSLRLSVQTISQVLSASYRSEYRILCTRDKAALS
jgi:hypothetical protein